MDERTRAIVEFPSGKATVEQMAFRFGVHPRTVEKWREVALEGIEQKQPLGKKSGVRGLGLQRGLIENLEQGAGLNPRNPIQRGRWT